MKLYAKILIGVGIFVILYLASSFLIDSNDYSYQDSSIRNFICTIHLRNHYDHCEIPKENYYNNQLTTEFKEAIKSRLNPIDFDVCFEECMNIRPINEDEYNFQEEDLEDKKLFCDGFCRKEDPIFMPFRISGPPCNPDSEWYVETMCDPFALI